MPWSQGLFSRGMIGTLLKVSKGQGCENEWGNLCYIRMYNKSSSRHSIPKQTALSTSQSGLLS